VNERGLGDLWDEVSERVDGHYLDSFSSRRKIVNAAPPYSLPTPARRVQRIEMGRTSATGRRCAKLRS
jgi:hypothetical protein